MTNDWLPKLERGNELLFLAIVRELENDIAEGKLPDGVRLPTIRELSDRLGVAIGTVTRAYGEAEQRGLIHSEGRRGTFVGRREHSRSYAASLVDRDREAIDLSMHLPVYSEDPDLPGTLKRLAKKPECRHLLHYPDPIGLPRHRSVGAKWIQGFGLEVDPNSVIITYGGQHALAIVLSVVAKPGDIIVTEDHTHPGVKAAAELLHLQLLGAGLDDQGLVPDSIASICKQRNVRALVVNPTLHNPTASTISKSRRLAIAALAERHGFLVVEDEAHRRLHPDPPPLITSMIPERSFLLASASKVIAGGLRVGFLIAPAKMRQSLIDAVHATTLMTSPLAVEVLCEWILDGTAERTILKRREEAIERQRMAGKILKEHSFLTAPTSYNIWLDLPGNWTTSRFVMEAHRRGVAVAPAEVFAVDESEASNSIRICLGGDIDRETLKTGLQILADLLGSSPPCGGAAL